MEQLYLPYKSVVMFIACGALIFTIVFLFAKRQITRFALRSNRVPHAAIGANTPKSLKQKIEQRLKRVADITYEPVLLSPFVASQPEYENCQFYFRMKAVDALKILDKELMQLYPDVERRKSQQPLRTFLLEQQQHKHGCLRGIRLETIDKFASVYEHARHDPLDFTQANYQEFVDLMNHLIEHMKKKSSENNLSEDMGGYEILEPEPSTSDLGEITKEQHSGSQGSYKGILHPNAGRNNVRLSQGSDIRNSYASDAASSDSMLDSNKRISFQPHSDHEGETDLLLMETQDSGSSSSQGSLAETEVTFRQFKQSTGEESFV